MKTTEPFRTQFGGFLLRLCFPDFLAIFFADFLFNLHTSAFIRIRLTRQIFHLFNKTRLFSKNSKKNLDSYYFVTLFDFLSLKNDVNVPSKSSKQKKLC